MEAGINKMPNKFPNLANVDTFIDEVSFGVDNTGNKYLEVKMKDSLDRTCNKRYYEPKDNPNYNIKKEKEAVKFNAVVANLVRKFNGEEFSITLPNNVTPGKEFDAYCNAIIESIKGKFENVPLRTKIILNKDDYPTLPGYAPIWEKTDVPEDKTILTINPDFKDRVEKNVEKPSQENQINSTFPQSSQPGSPF